MERPERPPYRRSRSKNPSFSSSLLDAIYRSIDGEHTEHTANRGAPDRSFPHKKQDELPNMAPSTADYYYHHPKTTPAVNRSNVTDSQRRRSASGGAFTPASNSSSSSSTSTTTATSSSTGFSSSSDAESIIRSDRVPRPDPSGPEKMPKKKKNSKCSSIRSGLRGLRRGRTPAEATTAGPSAVSPGARLASFLNALFASAGSPKKHKTADPTAAAAAATTSGCGTGEDSGCSSSASSCRRSCLSKAAASADRRRSSGAEAGKRSVRFCPVSVIVDEESRPCGHKRLQDDAAPVAARMEELLRAAGAEVEAEAEEEEDDGGSESSSDLFELENLTAIKERRGGYRDELPVFETTDLGINRAIAQGLVH